ncbi:hypothetical protein SARC_03824 [Sphaeroforma arctica JP610]|uniref:Uncharacterized protein n=1 Tax=Sphaeroforma arctica JP610 TaxID=667725 RepID=A0A0L0G4I0_9EUKA|nr:hypothetical protein SARC_03824 [Sphaeroforma arctica JP610]KNC83960.1 hypothetical protein SARC_03824 [Sphaeroforma arctica JP610]|eukprot:XP_014157862.1 hypothetical protein SARC_03824 [Sphaeroforma arctica JP610]
MWKTLIISALIALWLEPSCAQKDTDEISLYQNQHNLKNPPVKKYSKAFKSGDNVGLYVDIEGEQILFRLEEQPIAPLDGKTLQYTYNCYSEAHEDIDCSAALTRGGDVWSMFVFWGNDTWIFEGVGGGMSMVYKSTDMVESDFQDLVVGIEDTVVGRSTLNRREANGEVKGAGIAWSQALNLAQNEDGGEQLVDGPNFGYSSVQAHHSRDRRSTFRTMHLRITYDKAYLTKLAEKLNLGTPEATITQADTYTMLLLNHVNTIFVPQVGIKFEVYSESRVPSSNWPDGNYGSDGSTESNVTLKRFNADVNDNTDDLNVLFSGLSMGLTIGSAYLGGACRKSSNSAIVSPLTQSTYGIVSLLAHEIGHNFRCDHVDSRLDIMYRINFGSRYFGTACRASISQHIEAIEKNVKKLYMDTCFEKQTDSNPCFAEGVCGQGLCIRETGTDGKGYRCKCEDSGYEGDDCDELIDNCHSNNCPNEATCVNLLNSYTCDCSTGFSGFYCQFELCDAVGSQCREGKCTDGEEGYTCNCDGTGFTGKNCGDDIDECDKISCENGRCINLAGSYKCECDSGYEISGGTCKDINDCADDPCGAGETGKCIDEVGGYRCECYSGYTGKNCDVDIDECKNVSCGNGVCKDRVGSYECECETGFGGILCDQFDFCAESPCLNGGDCTSNDTGYTCKCADGYTGTRCAVDINECHDPTTCVRENLKTCIDQVNGVECVCKPGWGGDRCQDNTCDCGAGACDEDHFGEPICRCPSGWSGVKCEAPPTMDATTGLNVCAGEPCGSNGNCRTVDQGDGNTEFECSCFGGYTGKYCDLATYDPCASNPCNFAGDCRASSFGTFSCTCVPGRYGDLCEYDVNECDPDPCVTGTCSNRHNGFVCICPPNFTGETCNTLVHTLQEGGASVIP